MLTRFRRVLIAILVALLFACQTVVTITLLSQKSHQQLTATGTPIQPETSTLAINSPESRPSPNPTITPNHISTLTATLLPMNRTPTSIVTSVRTLTAITPAQAGEQRYYEVLFSIPVGDNGVLYRGGNDPDAEINGPSAIAVLPDGGFVIANLVGNRLLRYDSTGHPLKTIDLYTIDIVNVGDLRATDTELFVLEISYKVTPERYRVNRLSFDGEIKASYDIPQGFHIENGLTGIAIDCEGEVLLELEGGSNLYRLVDAQGNLNPASVSGDYHCNGKPYRVMNPGPGKTPYIIAGSIRLETQLTTGLGGFRLIDVLQNGGFYVIREDVVNDQVLKVDQTVHYIDADGVQQGVARVPIAEFYYPIMRSLAVGSDGNVYALLPKPDSVHIIRLNFFTSIEPLIPGAVTPLVTISNMKP